MKKYIMFVRVNSDWRLAGMTDYKSSVDTFVREIEEEMENTKGMDFVTNNYKIVEVDLPNSEITT